MITIINKAIAKRRDEDEEKGFTLIELLVVILIIGVLAAIAIPVFLNQQAGARDTAVKSDITNAKIAVVDYMIKNDGAIPVQAALDAGLPGFTAAVDSNLTITETEAGDGFCIAGHDETNGAASSFSADDTTGVDEGICGVGVVAARPAVV